MNAVWQTCVAPCGVHALCHVVHMCCLSPSYYSVFSFEFTLSYTNRKDRPINKALDFVAKVTRSNSCDASVLYVFSPLLPKPEFLTTMWAMSSH